ncbi:hypothetical protein JCM1840_005216 [Sporobolomyces johnsonii]
MLSSTLALSLGLATVVSAAFSQPAPLSDELRKLVKNRLAHNATDVWVAGTEIEALLEVDYPELSVFGASTVPPPTGGTVPTETNQIIAAWNAQRPSNATQFYEAAGGSPCDPASLGVGWMLAVATSKISSRLVVDQEIDYLMEQVVRLGADGPMSMRPIDEPISLWSDFVYMVPPFLAYYGVVNDNETIIQEAIHQIEQYRAYLFDNTTGLWQHTVMGWVVDPGLWATGNGWAAAGILRVAATIKKSVYWSKYSAQVKQLASYSSEIVDGAFARVSSDNLLPNYMNEASNATFSDAAGSALISSVAYRLAQLGFEQSAHNLETAGKIRAAVYAGINTTTGWVSPVVNPVGWTEQISASPESLAFVLLLDSAYKAYAATSS